MQITGSAFGDGSAIDPGIEVLPPGNHPQIGPVLDELEGQVLDE